MHYKGKFQSSFHVTVALGLIKLIVRQDRRKHNKAVNILLAYNATELRLVPNQYKIPANLSCIMFVLSCIKHSI